ncbi:MAG: tetratricopeptide repeat protein [Armatimonadetes bacterium]|nr:tetratricopeptide repeat protein [Armatimonadota bacterium]
MVRRLRRAPSRSGLAAVIVLIAAAMTLGGCTTRAQLIYRRAEMFFGQGQYGLAAQEYERVVQSYPRDTVADDALYKLAYLYRVHLGQPARALTAYRHLAENYPTSPYADDALLWCVHLWARQFEAPSQAKTACEELDRRFPDRKALLARAHLEVARAYVAQKRWAEARRETELVLAESGEEKNLAAQAALMKAKIAQAQGAKPEEVTKLLDEVVNKYPGTVAEQEARRRLGLMYYAQRVEDQKRRAEEMKKEAVWLEGVVFRRWRDPRLTMLDALRGLMRVGRGKWDVAVATLAAMSGRALLPVAEIRADGWPVLWQEDPLVRLVEACGMAPSVWLAQKKEEAWDATRRALIRGRPCLVCYGGKDGWVIVAGWRPEFEQVGVVRADRSIKAVPLKRFLAGWKTASQAAPYIAFPRGSYYVLTLAGERRKASEEELQAAGKAGLKDLLAAQDEVEVSRPVDLARQAALLLSTAGDEPPVPHDWAAVRLARWAEVRHQLAYFLKPWAPQEYEAADHIADVVASLRDAVLAAEKSDSPQRDYRAAASWADRLAAEEDNFAQALERLLASTKQ